MSQVSPPLRMHPRAAFEEPIRRAIQASIRAQQGLLAEPQIAALDQIARVIVRAYQSGNKLLIFGNGGSAAEAQHLAAEQVGRYYRDRPPLPALALTVNTSSLTAIGNDYSFTQVFARQVDALGREGDVALGISTNGPSALSGFTPGRILELLPGTDWQPSGGPVSRRDPAPHSDYASCRRAAPRTGATRRALSTRFAWASAPRPCGWTFLPRV